MNDILYYPYINLPKTDWTLRTLLYYENVGSIVPQQYFYRPENYDHHMLELIQNGLVTPINPMAVLEHPLEATRPFLNLIEENRNKLRRSQRDFRLTSRNSVPEGRFISTPIHADKFDDSIFHNLVELRLAERANDNWYWVEQRTADNLMKFLATLISAKTDRLPTTDILPFRLHKPRYLEEQQKRETILRNLIPFPEDIDLGKLISFKEKHADLLHAFRTKVELIALDPNIKMGSPLFQLHSDELLQRKQELAKKMNESKFKSVLFGTVFGLIGAYHGIATAATADAVIGGLPGFANAVYSALKIERAENVFDQSGLKYLALAERRIFKTVGKA